MNKVKIGDIATVYDGPHATPNKIEEGPIYLGLEGITDDGRFNPSGFAHLSKEDYIVWTRRVTPQENDIVFSYEATLGRYVLIPKGFYGCLGRRLGIVRCDKSRVNPRWLYYFFLSPEWSRFTQSHKVRGSTVDRLSVDDFPGYEIPLPPLDEQNRTVDAIFPIDQKIDLNTRLCSELGAMAKILYDYWFVQFDFPDENGKPYRTSGGAMKWCQELGREVPKGWKIDTIDHIISIIRGVSYQPSDELSSLAEGSIKLLKSNNIQDGSINFDSPVYLPSEKANSEQWLTKGSVFITMSSGSKLHMGKTAIVFDDLPYAFGAFCAKIKIQSLYQYWLAVYFRHELFRTHIENVTLGTSINNINAHHITSIKMAFPPKEILEQFNAVLSPCFDMQGKIMKENTQLQSMRDWLLPILMNGQAYIREIR